MGVAAIQREGEVSKFLWWVIAKRCTAEMLAAAPTFVTAHAVPERGEPSAAVKTMCGLPVPQLGPDTVWRMRDELGDRRPCDRCTRIIAIHDDRGDQPA